MVQVASDSASKIVELISFDSWLSKLLGCKAYRLNVDRVFGAQASSDAKFVLRQVITTSTFIDAKVGTDDVTTLNALTALGFQIVDVNLRLIRPNAPFADVDVEAAIRMAEPSDRTAVGVMAGRTFRYDRFHADPAIPDATANAIKSAWATNFFCGQRGDWMIVVEADGEIAGFLQLIRRNCGPLIIDLIGVDVHFEGRGFARAMIAYAARACAPDADMLVGTQVSNVRSLGLYEGLGFGVVSSSYVLHYHGAAKTDN